MKISTKCPDLVAVSKVRSTSCDALGDASAWAGRRPRATRAANEGMKLTMKE